MKTFLAKVLRPWIEKDFCFVMKHVGMSKSAAPATGNDVTRRLKPPKVTACAAVTLGTAKRPSRGRAADDCGRLPTVEKHKSSGERTRVHPQAPEVKREPFAYAFGREKLLHGEMKQVIKVNIGR